MGLRIGLEHTNSFIRLWEIIMSYISLKLQDENYFLKLWKLTHKWCVLRNKGLSKNRFKIEISIKTFGYSVKFDVRKKKGEQMSEFYRNVILWPRSRSKCPEKHSVTLVKNENFWRGTGPCFWASCFKCDKLKRSSKIFFSVSKRHCWAVVG